MSTTVAVIVRLLLFTTMVSLGLGLRWPLLRRWLQSPGLLLRVLVGSCLLFPLLALALLQTPWTSALSTSERTAVALMALCPSAPLSLRRARQEGGDHQLAALLQVGAAFVAIVSVPMLALLFRSVFGLEGWQVRSLPVVLQVGQAQVLPLLLGMTVRHRWSPLADRLERPMTRLANAALLLLLGVLLWRGLPLLVTVWPRQLPAMALMLLMACLGLGLGRLMAGPLSSHGVTTALVTALRNPGLALLLTDLHGATLPGLKGAILGQMAITALVSLPLVRLLRVGTAAPPAAAATGPGRSEGEIHG
jgi:predicted Na+-dependent transporter